MQQPAINSLEDEIDDEEFDRLFKALPKSNQPVELSPLFCASQEELENLPSATKDALSALIYDEDPNENGENFKEQGNNLLKKASANKTLYPQVLEYYGQGLEQKLSNLLLKAQLLSNRSHVHLLMGNNGHAIEEAKEAIKQLNTLVKLNVPADAKVTKVEDDEEIVVEDPNALTEQKKKAAEDLKVKCLYRVAKAATGIKKYKLAIQYAEKALQSKSLSDQIKKDILKVKQTAVSGLEAKFREREEKSSRRREEREIPAKIKQLLADRGIQIGDSEIDSQQFNQLIQNESSTAGHSSGIQILEDTGKPIFCFRAILIYDEFNQTDVIQTFSEEDTFEDHFDYLFPPNGSPFPYAPDDPTATQRYVNGNLEIAFYDQSSKTRIEDVFFKFSLKTKLRDILTHPRYKLPSGFMPVFHVAPVNSKFSSTWKKLPLK